jgi:hypothetical protein
MQAKVGIALLIMLFLGCTAMAQTTITSRAVSIPGGTVYLLDNDSDVTATAIGILFGGSANITLSDIIAFGGGAVTKIQSWGGGAFIDVELVPGGTLQITLVGDNASAKLLAAWIRK